MDKVFALVIRVFFVLILINICGCNVVPVGSDGSVVGIWVLDQDKMEQELETVMAAASEKASELSLNSPEEKLAILRGRLKDRVDGLGIFMLDFNSDGSAAIFPCMSRLNGKRGNYSGPICLALWSQDGNTVNFTGYSRPYTYSKPSESIYTIEDGYLVTNIATQGRTVKPDETNLLVLFDIDKAWFKKVKASSPEARKPKLFVEDGVEFDTPAGFSDGGLSYTAGAPASQRDYTNKSIENEGISLLFHMAAELAIGVDNGAVNNEQAVKMMTQVAQKRWLNMFPDAELKMTMGELAGENAGILEGLLDENDDYMKGPHYIKNYVLVDDGFICLEVIIRVKSPDRIKILDEYVKGIRLNLDKTWNFSREQLMSEIAKEDAAHKEIQDQNDQAIRQIMESKQRR